MSNLGSYQGMVVLAKRFGGPGKLFAAVSTVCLAAGAAGMRFWDSKRFDFRETKAVSGNEPEIAVVETPDGDLTVVEEGETSKSEAQLGSEQDFIDNVSSGESDEGLS